MKLIKLVSGIMLASMLVVAMLASGCITIDIDPTFRETVSGSSVIADYLLNYSDFSEIAIDGPIHADISRSNTFKFTLSVNENIYQYVQVNQVVNTLRVSLDPNIYYRNANISITLTLPDLRALGINGAGTCTLNGFNLEKHLEISVSGASTLKIQNIETSYISLTASGASTITGSLTSKDGRMHVSGASSIVLSGQCSNLDANVSGASQLKMSNFWVDSADIVASGVSAVDINVGSKLDIDLSGVSTMTYGGSPSLGTVRVDALSTLKRR